MPLQKPRRVTLYFVEFLCFVLVVKWYNRLLKKKTVLCAKMETQEFNLRTEDVET